MAETTAAPHTIPAKPYAPLPGSVEEATLNEINARIDETRARTSMLVGSIQKTTGNLGVYRAIAAITAALGGTGISKDKTATQGSRFSYRGVDQVYAALNPLLAQHNLSILPRYSNRQLTERTSREGNPLYLTTIEAEFDLVSAEDGSMHTIRTVGEAMDSGDKGTNKAMAIAFKYACFIAFCIPIEGDMADDPDSEVHTPVSSKGANIVPNARMVSIVKSHMDKIEEATSKADLEATWEGIEAEVPEEYRSELVSKINAKLVALKAIAKAKAAATASKPAAVPPSFGDDDIPF